jgi:hypothetical protein
MVTNMEFFIDQVPAVVTGDGMHARRRSRCNLSVRFSALLALTGE